MKKQLALALIAAGSLIGPAVSEACTRAVYFGLEGQTVTGRTMDWFKADMHTNIWLYPRGLERNSNTRAPFSWKKCFR